MYDYNEKRTIGSLIYSPVPGCFSGTPADWYSCRDYWFPMSSHYPYFFFSHDSHRGGHVAAFVGAIEKRLKLEERSRFGGVIEGDVQTDNITWIEASSFWLRHPMRRSLLTLLLRAGTTYNAENPTENSLGDAVRSYPMLASTWNAFWRFLDGFTYCDTLWPTTWQEHVARGWSYRFSNITWDYACQRLKHPREVAERISYFKWHNAGRPMDRADQFWHEAIYETEWPEGVPHAISSRTADFSQTVRASLAAA